jgi:hypothetical protein
MRPFFSARNRRAATLIEVLVSSAIMVMVVAFGFTFLIQGTRYLRLNQRAIDAQKSGLFLVTQLQQELQSTRQTLIAAGPDGVVFPSSFKVDGITERDPMTQQLLWQNWVCYAYDAAAKTVVRRELPISPASTTPAGPPPVTAFSVATHQKLMASDISVFQLSQVTASPPLWQLDVTAGNMTDRSGYGVELQSKVSPKN